MNIRILSRWLLNPILYTSAMMFLSSGLSAGEGGGFHAPRVRLPLMKNPPKIDGKVDEKEWAEAARMEGLGREAMLSPAEVGFWVGCDGKELFIAMVSETPPGGQIQAAINPAPGESDARTWSDDSVEVVLDPLRTDPTNRRRLYHANINAKGAVNDTAYVVNDGGEAWRGDWRIANEIVGDRWHFEAAISLQSMKVKPEDLARPFGIRICRNWQQSVGPEQTEWSPLGGAYLNPETSPVVTWDPAAPVAQVLQLRDPGTAKAHIRLSVFNPHAKPMEVQALIKCVPKSSAPSDQNSTVSVAPGATAMVELTPAMAGNEEMRTLIQVTSKDGKTGYYLREFNWKLQRPDPLWTVAVGTARRVTVDFAYFPYYNIMKVKVDVNSLEDKSKVRGIKLRIVGKKDSKEAASTVLSDFKEYVARADWKTPPLAGGEYELVAELQGVQADPIRQDFARYPFEWEHNQLGRSDVVIAPFTPITVKGNQVGTVLRQHTMNDLGLWDQVESLGQPLLKSPMRLEVKAGGKVQPVKGKGLKFVEKQDPCVVTQSTGSGGGLNVTTRSEWDYDGMMKWTLELQPTESAIEGLTLVIPVANSMAPLFHACTDGIRFNYAGKTPSGEGPVWDAGKAARNSIIGSYVPYIWLGAEERGICAFGENDRGWVNAEKVPCQELVRKGDTLELRYNLIAKPVDIDQPQRILIGFQATPVKPLPEGWRRLTMGAAPEGGRNLAFLGSCWYWGTLTPCLDIYPRDEDFSIYAEFAKTRKTGQINDEFIQKWLKGYRTKTKEEVTTFRNHINAGFHAVAGAAKGGIDVLVYTNARGVRFDTKEGQTFLNEWHREPFPTRKWDYGGGVAYDLNPGESFRDYAMWYYKKMFDTFVDAIYWDDIFPQSCFHTVGTDAYERPDGTIQPIAGIFDMRELIRRTAVLNHELHKPNRNMVHMTNTELVPVLAFAGTNYAWEDRTAGGQDFQDRYPRDYLRAESIGLQTGNIPFAMVLTHGMTDKDRIEWVKRTAGAVALVHEIKLAGGPWSLKDYCESYDRLFNFGYGLPEVKVFTYWNPDNPVAVKGVDAVPLTLSKAGSALVVVCDYGNGGDATLEFNLKALALSGALKATDMEAKQALTVTADGKIGFPLKKHDYKLVLVEKTEEGK